MSKADLSWYTEVYGENFGPGGAVVAIRSALLFMEGYCESGECDIREKTLLSHLFAGLENNISRLAEMYSEQVRTMSEGEYDLDDAKEYYPTDYAEAACNISQRSLEFILTIFEVISQRDTSLKSTDEKTDFRKIREKADMPLNKGTLETVSKMLTKMAAEIYAQHLFLNDNGATRKVPTIYSLKESRLGKGTIGNLNLTIGSVISARTNTKIDDIQLLRSHLYRIDKKFGIGADEEESRIER